MDDYISKPLDLGRLATVLARRRSESSARQVTPVEAPVPDREEETEAALGDRLGAIRSSLPPAAFDRICELFLSNTPGVIHRLGVAVRAGDADTARDVAHNLKGSMATLGAVRLSALAGRLEDGVGGGEAGVVLRQIDEEYDKARAVIRSLMTTSPGG
jgi:HPt (histidine-containing phosphotransfer) domain-containing protein